MPRRTPRVWHAATVVIGVLVMATVTSSCSTFPATAQSQSSMREDGKFRNAKPRQSLGVGKTLKVMWSFATGKDAETVPTAPIPVHAILRTDLLAAPDGSLWRLGHSTMLLKVGGQFWLTDPVFSDRASPFQFIGPKRFHAPPISIDELPPIEGVVLSHDHYDHLDYGAIQKLAPKVAHFITPLGVGDRLIEWGVPAAKVQQLDWWQSTTVGALELTATPAQHFSGRGLGDSDRTLWASWVLRTTGQGSAEGGAAGDGLRIFFSGDTGYFDGFKAIGERFGPFDLTMVETGAYNADWPDVHMQPEQSLQAHLDLKGRYLMPIHNGTFDLSMHPWTEPFERITALAEAAQVPLVAPVMGERIDLHKPALSRQWWRTVQAPQTSAGLAPASTPSLQGAAASR